MRPANENASTAAIAGPLPGGGSRTAETGRGTCPRSAQTDFGKLRAVKTMADHGRIVVKQAAGGDRKRERELLRMQGEIFVLAGLQLLAESGEA